MMRPELKWSVLALSLCVWGCSDPVPAPADGAITLSVHPASSSPGKTCPSPGKGYTIGNPTGSPPVTLVNGQGATVSCAVKGSTTFSFSASFQGTTSSGDSVTIGFSGGTLNKAAATGTANVAVLTNDLLQTFSSPTSCAISGLQVQPGAVLAHFACSTVEAPPSGACGVEGNFVFDNCDQ